MENRLTSAFNYSDNYIAMHGYPFKHILKALRASDQFSVNGMQTNAKFLVHTSGRRFFIYPSDLNYIVVYPVPIGAISISIPWESPEDLENKLVEFGLLQIDKTA